MEAVKKLKQRRSAVRTNIKRIFNSASEIISGTKSVTIQAITVIIQKLERYKSDLKSLNEEILQKLSDDAEIGDEIQKSVDFDEQIIDIIAELSALSSQGSVPVVNTVQTSQCAKGNVLLPKLDLKSFDGNSLNWTEFWDAFEAAVHNNSRLKAVEKFNYLITKVLNEAKESISGLQLTNDNYDVAIDILKKRFGSKNNIINMHYIELMKMSASSSLTSKLRETNDGIEKHFRSLEALGEDSNQKVFIPMIILKLPEDVLMQLEMARISDEWTVKELRDTLSKYIKAREASEFNIQKSNSQQPNQQLSASSTKKMKSSTEVLLTGERTYYQRRCLFCKRENHWSDECRQFKTSQERKERIKNRCNICLKLDHRTIHCNDKRVCFHCEETGKHHRSICPTKFPPGVSAPRKELKEKIEDKRSEQVLVASGEGVILQTALATVKNSTIVTKVRVLLDTGSHRTYITENLAKHLNLTLENMQEISVGTFGTRTRKTIQTPATKLNFILKDGTKMTINANVVPTISAGFYRTPIEVNIPEYINRKTEMADDLPQQAESSSIEILIGSDYYLDFTTSERITLCNGLYLVGSKFGWNFAGRFAKNGRRKEESGLLAFEIGDTKITEYTLTSCSPQIETFWNLDGMGIEKEPSKRIEIDILNHFYETIHYQGDRYYVTWPWIDEHFELKSNYLLATGRLQSLLRRLERNSDLMKNMCRIFDQQETAGIIERVDQNNKSEFRVHYLPHHPVINLQKSTTKIRIVYDASAKLRKHDRSLNECMHRGPLLLQNLCGLLIRFRLHKIGIVADIEKAFLQVALQESERDVTRFLWIKDAANFSLQDNLIIYRFCRVPFGVVSSPFLLASTIQYHLEKQNSIWTNKIKNDIYVDNLLTGVETLEEAINLYTSAKNIFMSASMNLREWTSNSKQFTSNIACKDRVDERIIGVLGLKWDTTVDTLCIPLYERFNDNECFTKRIVLRTVASIYDPLGFFSPLTLVAKLFLQDLWTEELKWDEELSIEKRMSWNQIFTQLKDIPNISIPRFTGISEKIGEVKNILHCFCDASKRAYAVCIYLIIETSTGYSSNLIFSKARLAPKKGQTIPRMELMAVLIAVRCLKFVETGMMIPIHQRFIWSDSQCVLHWIQSSKCYKAFVQRRLEEIRSLSSVSFYYVPTSENPSDIATRGTNAKTLKSISNWWRGPGWLNDHTQWPKQDWMKTNNTEISEVREANEEITNTATDTDKKFPFEIDERSFSSLTKLTRVTAWCTRFVTNCRKINVKIGALNSQEIKKAEDLWLLQIQKIYFPDVFHSIQHNIKNSIRDQLGVFKDTNGILRVGGRLAKADISENAKNPKLLPKKSYFTWLVVQQFHIKLMHSGVPHTLSQIRYEFWIPQGRTAVRSILKDCKICKKVDGGHYQMPIMPPLPTSRVTRSTPFTYTGLDYL
jgi:hypothetical protein